MSSLPNEPVQLMEYLKDESIPKRRTDRNGQIHRPGQYLCQELKDTYGQDLKLDPYPAPGTSDQPSRQDTVSENILTEYFTCNPGPAHFAAWKEKAGRPWSRMSHLAGNGMDTISLPFMQKTGVRAIEKQGPWTLDIEEIRLPPD